MVEYHGGDFVGWQVQPNGRSVQAALMNAAESFLGSPHVVIGSGRTDSGVHALGQVAALTTTVPRTSKQMVGGLNKSLPADVAVVEASQVPLAFDPRRWAWEKHYRYRFLDLRPRSPLVADQTWLVRRELDVEAMDAAAAHLVGTYDYASFQAAGCAAATTVRTLDAFRVTRHGPEVHLDVKGHGFLRHMVRIVAGTLMEVGVGRRPPAWMQTVIAAADRRAAGRTLPAKGLTLVSVTHGPGPRDYGHASHSLDRG